MLHMKTLKASEITLRCGSWKELRQRVEKGEVVGITDRGRLVAGLVPASPTRFFAELDPYKYRRRQERQKGEEQDGNGA